MFHLSINVITIMSNLGNFQLKVRPAVPVAVVPIKRDIIDLTIEYIIETLCLISLIKIEDARGK